MKVKRAEKVASLDNAENVRGREQKKAMIATIAENPIVQTLPGATVFKYLAPTKQWKPWGYVSSCKDYDEAGDSNSWQQKVHIPG